MLTEFVLTFAALVIVITIHECCHALTAYFFGDPTAKLAGRISLNPLRHLDPLGTLMMLMIHIGWGKPTPVNPRYFKNPKLEEALTALAGPASNLVLALILALPLKYLPHFIPGPIQFFMALVMDVSVWLFAFNILPFPPLDGSKILAVFVPKRFEHQYQRYLNSGTVYFLLFLLFDQFILGGLIGYSIVGHFIGTIFTYVKSIIYLGT